MELVDTVGGRDFVREPVEERETEGEGVFV